MVEDLQPQSSCASGIDTLQATIERGQRLFDQYRRSPDAAEHLADQMQRKLNDLEAELESALQAERSAVSHTENTQLTLTDPIEQQERQRLADSHLRKARNHGCLGIGQTQLGLLTLYYDANDRTYQLVQCGTSPNTIAQGKQAVVKQALMQSYAVDD